MKVGRSEGLASQHASIVLYLHKRTGPTVGSQFTLHAAHGLTHSHVWRAVLGRSHPGSLLQPLAKLFIYVETRIGGRSCPEGKDTHWLLQPFPGIRFSIFVDFLYGLQENTVALTQREDLPQQNAVGPHVTLGGEHLVKDGLWGHPLERETGLRANQKAGEGLQENPP